MFIRKTRKRDPVTKKFYFAFQLVESFRTERGPRQRILLNLGSDLNLNTEEPKELANRIEEIVNGQPSLFPSTPRIETLAQRYASRFIKKMSQPVDNKVDISVTDLATIDLNSVTHQEPRTVGGEDLLLRIAQELKIPEKLKELNFSAKETAVALGSIIVRATSPASERATQSRLIDQSGMGELLNFDFNTASLHSFYHVSDQLLKHKDALEEHVTTQQKLLHNQTDTIALYDLTNTYFEGQAQANCKAQFGRSKEKRSDCRLVTLGLVMNQHGFLKRSKFLPGNMSEAKSLQDAIKTLASSEDLFKPTIVMDAGIATEENLSWLRENHYTYVVSARQKPPSLEVTGDPTFVGNSTTYQVKVVDLPVRAPRKMGLLRICRERGHCILNENTVSRAF